MQTDMERIFRLLHEAGVAVRSVDEETGVAFGLITRIIRRHSRLR